MPKAKISVKPKKLLTQQEATELASSYNTLKNRRSRWEKFLKYLGWVGETLPIKPELLTRYAAQLVQWEFAKTSVRVIIFCLIQLLCKEQKGFDAPPGTLLRNLCEVEGEVKRLTANADVRKAKPAQMGKKFNAASKKAKAIAVLWRQLGTREDTLEGIQDTDVTECPKAKAVSSVRLWEDKVANVKGRTLPVGCACKGKTVERLCPLHGPYKLQKKDFPLSQKDIKAAAEAWGSTGHGIRRALALSLREEQERREAAGEEPLLPAGVGWYLGWENTPRDCKMWAEYTKDYGRINYKGMSTSTIRGVVKEILAHQKNKKIKGEPQKFPKEKGLKKEKIQIKVGKGKVLAKGRNTNKNYVTRTAYTEGEPSEEPTSSEELSSDEECYYKSPEASRGPSRPKQEAEEEEPVEMLLNKHEQNELLYKKLGAAKAADASTSWAPPQPPKTKGVSFADTTSILRGRGATPKRGKCAYDDDTPPSGKRRRHHNTPPNMCRGENREEAQRKIREALGNLLK